MWIVLALLSSIFAVLTSIFAKIGITGVDSTLATALRTIVVLIMVWGMVFINNSHTDLSSISRKSWIFLILSGLATGASWLCYFKALQMGQTTSVVAIDKLSIIFTIILAVIFLHEQFTLKSALGSILIAVGTLLMVL